MFSFYDECGEFLNLHDVLFDDLEKSDAETDSPVKRRTFVRTGFALIEGTTYRFKLLALNFAKDRKVQLSPGEVAALTGETYRINDGGRICRRRLHISTVANLQLTLRLSARCFDVVIPKPKDPKLGWKRLGEAVCLRNRLTHP